MNLTHILTRKGFYQVLILNLLIMKYDLKGMINFFPFMIFNRARWLCWYSMLDCKDIIMYPGFKPRLGPILIDSKKCLMKYRPKKVVRKRCLH